MGRLGSLWIVPCPQHEQVSFSCLCCGKEDGRTNAGGIACQDCTEEGKWPPRAESS